jgi:hypothetical protein
MPHIKSCTVGTCCSCPHRMMQIMWWAKKALPTLQGFSQKAYRAIPVRVVMPDSRGDTDVVSYSGSCDCMDAGGRAPTVGALSDAGAVAESFHDWVPKLELGNQRIKRCKTDQAGVTGAIPLPRSVSNFNESTCKVLFHL